MTILLLCVSLSME